MAKLRESIAVKTLRKASHHVSDNQSISRSSAEDPQFKKESSQRRRSSLECTYKDASDPIASYMYNDAQRGDRTDSVNISESSIMDNYCFSGIRPNHTVSRSNSISSFCSYQDMTSTTDYSDIEVTKQEHTSGIRFKKKRGRSNSKTSLLERLLQKGRSVDANDKILSCPASPKSDRYRRISKNAGIILKLVC